jgi:N-acetylglucosamine-6-phosphate deacetylase
MCTKFTFVNSLFSTGVHVEGPYIAHDKNGAHASTNLRSAAGGFEEMRRLYGISSDVQPIRMITVAPEVEGVIDAVELLIKAGITVSVG